MHRAWSPFRSNVSVYCLFRPLLPSAVYRLPSASRFPPSASHSLAQSPHILSRVFSRISYPGIAGTKRESWSDCKLPLRAHEHRAKLRCPKISCPKMSESNSEGTTDLGPHRIFAFTVEGRKQPVALPLADVLRFDTQPFLRDCRCLRQNLGPPSCIPCPDCHVTRMFSST